jgi:IS5 family transposase
MDQISFSEAEAEYETKKRKMRREIFLEQVGKLIPWAQLKKKVARYYLKGQTGRPPYPLPTMRRVNCMQLFYNLSDPAMEDALYKIESMRNFAGLKLDRLEDETTTLKFRHFVERHGSGKALFKEVNEHLEKNGLMLRKVSMMDAMITYAPSSTKNERGGPALCMHQARKGKQYFLFIKCTLARILVLV